MKAVAASILCLASVALADDFKTINGKEYKDANVSRVEPDGIVVTVSYGIIKIPFEELPPELQQKYHFDPKIAAKFRSQVQSADAERESALEAAQQKRAEALEAQGKEQAERQKEHDEQIARERAADARRAAAANTAALAQQSNPTAESNALGQDALLPPGATNAEEVDAVRARTSAISKGGPLPLPLSDDADIEEIRVYYSSRIRSATAAGKTELAEAWKEQADKATRRWAIRRIPH